MAASQQPAVVLVTGAAGFIGYHVALRLLRDGHTVLGLDNLNSYYDVKLKEARVQRLAQHAQFRFKRLDLADRKGTAEFFAAEPITRVVHLAAQAGVRYSMENPHAYVDSNIVGFTNVLEGCRRLQVEHLVYASSSSVYGGNTHLPFSVHDNVDHPVSLYAATKKANELFAHVYSHLYALPTTGLRMFSVYGPWGRPDMAIFSFTRAILRGEPINVYNHGQLRRDFTYIDDIVEGLVRILARIPQPTQPGPDGHTDPSRSSAPYRIFNIGKEQPVEVLRVIEILEEQLGRKAQKRLLPVQPEEVPQTCSDGADFKCETGFTPCVSIEDGIRKFLAWYLEYYAHSEEIQRLK